MNKKEGQKSCRSSSPVQREKVRAGRKPKQAIFQGADVPRKARGLKDSVRRIFVHASLSFYSSCILFSSVSMHAFLCATRTYFVWRDIYSEGSTLGGLCLCFFVFLSLSSLLRGWINFLFATRWSTPFI